MINLDDPKGIVLIGLTNADVITYGLGRECQVSARDITSDKSGLSAILVTPGGECAFRSSLIGYFNMYNILAASATALSLNVGLDDIAAGIESLESVPGRMERIANEKDLTLVVDYAHTPDALLKAFKAVGPLAEGKLISVFGCGGDRDKGKRYEMGFIAGQMSDLVIITSDNPRGENPLTIIEQIERGVVQAGKNRLGETAPGQGVEPGYVIEADRRAAIGKAVTMAGERDLVLIAGKGHEDYQIIGNERRHFDDREETVLAASKYGQ